MDGFAQGLVGVVLDDRYRLDAVLGEGGMGAVFRAHHLAMDRKVAVKLLKPHLSADDAALQRFAREARATLKVDSPHAVKVLDFGITPLRDYYMVLEYLDGRTVQRELDIDGAFAPARVIHVARQALHALAASHRRGLVHRDIKPDNIFLMRVDGDPDYAKLLDFGVAKLMEGAAVSSQSQLALTAAGMVFGTPEFMSPEQACGHKLDGRSDLYSLATTMFTMLTGTTLFEGKSAIEWLTHHARTPPPRLATVRPELAAYPELDDLLQTCLAKHRDRRPRDADEMSRLLGAIATPVGHAPAAPATARVKTIHSPSGYISVLAPEIAPALADSPPPTTGLSRAVRTRRSGWYLALIAVAVAAMVAVAIAVAMRKREPRPEPITAAAGPGARLDAAPADAPVAVEPPVDAAPADAPSAAMPHPIHSVRPTALDDHLRNAEEARKADNRIKELAEADLALQIDPHNARATYFKADVLLKDGQREEGCAYLHALGKNPVALARAHAAGCTD